MVTINELDRKQLILNDIDKDIWTMESTFQAIFYRAYYQSVYEKENLEKYAPFTQKKISYSTQEERFEHWVNEFYRREFFYKAPDQLLREYDTVVKEAMVEYAEEHYPFIKIDDDLRQQIKNEHDGIQSFFEKGCGHIIYINEGVYCIYAQKRFDKKRTEISFIYPKFRNKLYWEDVIKYIDPKKRSPLLNQNYYNIKIFDLYVTGTPQNLSLGIRASIETLIRNVELSEDTFIAGEYSTIGQMKQKRVSKKRGDLARKNGAKRILAFYGKKPKYLTKEIISDILIEYYSDFECLQGESNNI